jgi:hypothetical protein
VYEIDEKDRVVPLDLPTPDTGDPLPIVLSKDGAVILSYMSYVAKKDMNVIVSFPLCLAHYFGPPNDEAFEGHPLAKRGLKPYGVYQVLDSSWIRQLERRNAVHSRHDKARFLATWKHFVFAFHDSILECVAKDFGSEMTEEDDDTIKLMAKRLYK